MSTKTDPFWKEQGLPDECPKCGERDDLYAVAENMHVPNDANTTVESATVSCLSCDADWDWTNEGDE